MMVSCALFTALMIVGAFISIPLPFTPIPIVLTDFFIMLAGLFLGCKYGLISVGLYIALGFMGLPIFSGGKAGLAVLFGPTGGYLIGYLLAVCAIGLILRQRPHSLVRIVIALVCGNCLLYLAGVPWLKAVSHTDWTGALATGLLPFALGIVIKITAVAAVALVLLPRFPLLPQKIPSESKQS